MDIEVHLAVGGIVMLILAVSLVIGQYKERFSALSVFNTRTKTKNKEKRAYPRHKVSLRAKYKSPLDEGLSWVKDISIGGVRLFLSKSLEIGTSLSLEIYLPYEKEPVSAEGLVVWTGEDDAGINFGKIDRGDLKRIFQYANWKKELNSSAI